MELVITPLVLLTICHGTAWSRSIPCFIVTIVTLVSFEIYPTGMYFLIADNVGHAGYTAAFPFAAVIILGIFTNRFIMQSELSTCLIVLFTAWILIIAMTGWAEGIGANVDPFLEIMQFIVYVAELALMLSTKLTGQVIGGIRATHGYIRGHALGRGVAKANDMAGRHNTFSESGLGGDR